MPQDIREALDPDTALPSLDELAALRAIARLDPDGEGAVALRDVARECHWKLGVRVTRVIATLAREGFISHRPRTARTIRLTDDGWHALGRLAPRERIWRDGFATGQATAAATWQGWQPKNETLCVTSAAS